MLSQCATSFLMVRPQFIRPNVQTASTNNFQSEKLDDQEQEKKAIDEFNHISRRLVQNDISLIIFDNISPECPDAVFPNNWISFHHDGKVVLYPLMASNRRQERKHSFIAKIAEQFEISEVIDLTHFENEGKFLEGTGSVVFDHRHKTAYASISPRTNTEVLKYLCDRIGYNYFTFHGTDGLQAVYHTNVLLHIGNEYAVICFEAIPDIKERNDLRRMLAFTGHEIVAVSIAQMKYFAGNMVQVVNQKGKYYTLLSSQAIRTLHLQQINVIGEKSELLTFDVQTIEKIGGGSIRCMLAEIFSPLKMAH